MSRLRRPVKILVLGNMGSGKTYFVQKFFLDDEPQHLVIDGHDEYKGYTRYMPRFLDNYDLLQGEIKTVMKKLVFPNCAVIEKKTHPKKPLKLLVIDEADIYMPSRKPLNFALRRAYVNHRHYSLSIVAISRRVTDLNTYVADLADFIVIFNLTGYNSLKTIRNINTEIDLKSLDYYNYEFYVLDRARNAEKFTLDTIPPDYFMRERRKPSTIAPEPHRSPTTGQETIRDIISKGKFALISATTDSGERTQEMYNQLTRDKVTWKPGTGKWEGNPAEPTAFIPALSKRKAILYGKEFGQKAVICGMKEYSCTTAKITKTFTDVRFFGKDEEPKSYTEVEGIRFELI